MKQNDVGLADIGLEQSRVGYDGPPGATGVDGEQGPQGPKGDTGPAGPLIPNMLGMQSGRDFPLGTLITTNIYYASSSGEPFLLEIEGNSYGQKLPFQIRYQGYIYEDTVIHHGGFYVGTPINSMVLFNHGGNLCFWFPSQGYWQGYTVFVNDANPGSRKNRVVSITNSAKPAGTTKEVTMVLSAQVGSQGPKGDTGAPGIKGDIGPAGPLIAGVLPSTSAAVTVDFNGLLAVGWQPNLYLGTGPNGPGVSSYFIVQNLFYGGSQITQIAYAYASPADSIYMRGRYDSVWSAWTRIGGPTIAWSDPGGSPSYVVGANAQGAYRVFYTGNLSVNYATSAGYASSANAATHVGGYGIADIQYLISLKMAAPQGASVPAQTVFPIGHIVWTRGGNGNPFTNSSRGVYTDGAAGSNSGYTRMYPGENSVQLAGTWVARGADGTGAGALMQRVA